MLLYRDQRGMLVEEKWLACRLRETSQRLRAESNNLQPMTMQAGRTPQGSMSDIMLYISGEGQPSHYGKSFDALADWVDHCLDMYRVGAFSPQELFYPTFQNP